MPSHTHDWKGGIGFMVKRKGVVLGGLSIFAGWLIGQWYYGHRLEDANEEIEEKRGRIDDIQSRNINLSKSVREQKYKNRILCSKIDSLKNLEKENAAAYVKLSKKCDAAQAKASILQKQVNELKKQAKDTGIQEAYHIFQKDKDGKLVGTYNSFKEAAEKTGVTPGLIFSVLSGRRKTAGGFSWECDIPDIESGTL